MKKIIGIGETVLDIIFKDGQPRSAKAGGSMFNSLISLSRSGLKVNYISELGKDKTGDLIADFLVKNRIDLEYIYRYDEGKTALAMAFLDEENNAEYDFYKIFPSKRLDVKLPAINCGDILLFGSSFAINPAVREPLIKLVKAARDKGCIIVYDPNYRKREPKELAKLKPYIEENIDFADIIRGSDEDFQHIFGFTSAEETYNYVKNRCSILVYTANKNDVILSTPKFRQSYPIEKIKPISTIGAGDNFNAGIIYELAKLKLKKETLGDMSKEQADAIIKRGISFAKECCLSYENYINQKKHTTSL